MEHFSGLCMLILAMVHGGYMAWQMAQHKI
jgi:type IV secretory pathway TrbF-like protein